MSQGARVIDTSSGKTTFNSLNPRLQVAVDRDPPHLNKVTVAPTAIATTLGGPVTVKETLYKIKHGLGYKPRVLIYFLRSGTNRYDCGKTFYGFGAVDDLLEYAVDEQFFYINHTLNDYFQQGFTSIATGTADCKFLIFSNPVNNYTDPNLRT